MCWPSDQVLNNGSQAWILKPTLHIAYSSVLDILTRLIGDSDNKFIHNYVTIIFNSSHRRLRQYSILTCINQDYKIHLNILMIIHYSYNLPPFYYYYTPPWRALVIDQIHVYTCIFTIPASPPRGSLLKIALKV